MLKRKILLPIFLVFFLVLFVVPRPVHANVLDDLVNGVKNFLFPEKHEVVVDSNITLAPDGDVDNNGQIDAGDIIRFSYTIKNTTEHEYSFLTLKTNINRKQINFISNVIGASSLNDDGKTITIPYLHIGSNQVATVSFDARINYYTTENPTLVTEGELMDKDNKSLIKSEKKEITAKKISKNKIPRLLDHSAKKEEDK